MSTPRRTAPALRLVAVLAGGGLGLAAAARADTVELVGGRTVEGIVLKEDSERVVLDVGMGQVSFPREQVARVERSAEDDNRRTRQAWQTRYVAENDLPEAMRPLYRDWDRLQGLRQRALEGARALDAVAIGEARVEKIPAVVVPGSPGPGLDGLLGMSFLAHFEIAFDAAARRIELRRLVAR